MHNLSHPADLFVGGTSIDAPVGQHAPTGVRPATPRAAGSPSYGDCRACPSTWALIGGFVPDHADRTQPRAGLRRICPGSGHSPASFLESFDSDLLEA